MLCRDLLSAYLISWAKQQFPDKVRFYFDRDLDKLRLDDNTVSFLNAASEQNKVRSYDLFVGADGANSR
jgi:2-polyprenyl-6-methoxyphenol hydroxylase-like FAD-dependent oxidoreductase